MGEWGLDNTKQVTNNELQQQEQQQNIMYIMATYRMYVCIVYVIVLSIYIYIYLHDPTTIVNNSHKLFDLVVVVFLSPYRYHSLYTI